MCSDTGHQIGSGVLRSSTLATRSALIRKLTAFQPLSPTELRALAVLQRHIRYFQPGKDLGYETQAGGRAYILRSGWCYGYKVLPEGGRQITNIKISGDFIGLRSVLLRSSDHNVAPLTPVTVAEITPDELRALLLNHTRLAACILWAAARDEAILTERLVSLGRRDAAARMGHFFLEMSARLKLIGYATEDHFQCPLSQYFLADLLGLSAIHVNRVLRKFRENGLLTFHNNEVRILDRAALIQLCGFNLSYLDQSGLNWGEADDPANG